jgi:aspartyl/glutamyl-tRNA(Asn/Gln) amidotransferase C subunit
MALLARLRIDDGDLPELRRQMQEIIAMVACLPGLEAGAGAPEPEMPLRTDVPRTGLAQTVVLDLAAHTSDALIAVPAVLSGEDPV